MRGAASASAMRLADELRQLLQALGADDDIDQVRALEKRAGFLLRHAAGHGDNGRAACLFACLAHLSETRIQLLFGALADAARIDDHDIGVARLGRRLIASLLQQTLPSARSRGRSSGSRRFR